MGAVYGAIRKLNLIVVDTDSDAEEDAERLMRNRPRPSNDHYRELRKQLAEDALVLSQLNHLKDLQIPEQIGDESNENGPSELNCVICFENKRHIVLVPCAHFCMCTRCANLHKVSRSFDTNERPQFIRCPICRTATSNYFKVFY